MKIFRSHKILYLSTLIVFSLLVNNCSLMAKDIHQNKLNKKNMIEKMKKAKIVFLITKDPDNYEADKTVPLFAEMLRKKYGYDVTVLLGSGEHGSYRYPNMEIVSKADLLIIFARRIALPHEQMDIIKNYLSKGKPLIGIRTANHAFKVMGKIEEGFEDWPDFVADILGCENRGYGPVGPGMEISVVPEEVTHPILKNVARGWHVDGNVYLVAPLLDMTATVLLNGKTNNITEPVAWTR
ncbi:MAG: hypothetical protein ABI325_11970, partial [Ginsengibacter sp.]